ncbi:DUF927 domain-containing protein [Neisseria animalis]|uniref:DUF927 domain-containing protein n=1 Tax=Neisseria animalis TaxID=492 RepID=A0A5P3MQG7_NEIAN|nr:DUF927 domain-containing protein [Neisseria animalis]QEY23814.1 DUF927 domain-containing protein [Neisseria animalis]ROW31593.1 DUF927 domain-containing protein [Neisseria animalis]VEE09780.1 putative superfamily II helicase [Neisseria animalis]
MTTITLDKAAAAKLAEFEPVSLKPYFECKSSGVYYIAIEADRDGNVTEKPPLRLSDPIELIGRGIDGAGNHYRIIKWRDSYTRQSKTAALAMAEIGTPQCWQRLQSHGLAIKSGRRARELLSDYLQADGATTPYTVTDKAGWINGAYILPNGEALQPADTDNKAARVIYNGDTSQQAAYTVSGSLEDWQREIAAKAAGNSRLCLAIGTALAAPLLAILNEQNGGFHLYGDSSDGKTTAALVGLSVWGNPAALKMAWRGTDLGFSNAALARNDGLLVLDEIGEAHPKTISKTAYSVINGKSKIQGAKDGGNRTAQEWRVLLLSTGEYSLQAYMERTGEKWEAGQAVRLPSIPAATRYGIYDTLHGHQNGAVLSDHLQAAAAQYHGAAGRAWIAKLQQTDRQAIQTAFDAFLATLPDLNSQAARVSRRFALVAAALELAADITGLAVGVGMAGVKQCFDDWYSLNGAGKYEDRRIIEAAAAFMARFADTARFANWNTDYTDRDHAGYKRPAQYHAASMADIDEYWIIPPVFESEVINNADTAKACTVLHGIGWLMRGKDNRWKHKKRGKGRFYVLVGVEPPEDDTDND